MASSDQQKCVLLITGANRGIGFELVKKLITITSPCLQIYLCARSPEKATNAVASLGPIGHGHILSPIQLDVTDKGSIKAAAGRLRTECGRLNILVSNAGIISKASDATVRLREALETNVIGPFELFEAFKDLLVTSPDRESNRVIHLTSDLGSVTGRLDPQNKLYHATAFEEYRISKAAVNMMSANQSYALRSSGVKVIAFNPGFTATDLTGNVEAVRSKGARDPVVVAEALMRATLGERDDERLAMVDVDGVLPW